MVSLYKILAAGLPLLQPLVNASFMRCLAGSDCAFTRANLSASQVAAELGPKLSNSSLIYGPDSSLYVNATARYQAFHPPNIQLVVQPGTEEDIPRIVQYANNNSIPFLTVNRGHSLLTTMNSFTGVQIDMASLRNISINADGKTAWFQGGTYDQQVMEYLWEEGFVATTGSCSCVGMMGPGLGGGYGRYQGLYGFISDNLVTLNVVLANGSTTTVSEDTNNDLLWAMRGGGHNFGIVTSFELKIYPKDLDTWYYKNYFWSQDKLEQVIEAVNTLYANGTPPVELAIQSGTFLVEPGFNTSDALVAWTFGFSSSQEDAEEYLAPFDNITALLTQDGNLPYPEIPHAQGSGLEDPLCEHGWVHQHAHAGLWQWNATAIRSIYDLFNDHIQDEPLFNNSIIMLEGYGFQGVREIDSSTSAFPWRNAYNVIGVITINYLPNGDLDSIAENWRVQTRDLWYEGQPGSTTRTYINYAYGDETLESIYGDSLPRLQTLKAQYDPEGRFNYYNAITY